MKIFVDQLKTHALSTPKHWWILAIFGLALLLAQPIFTYWYYDTMLRRGAYPPDGDSIGIPIAMEYVAWKTFLPVQILALAYFLLRYPGRVTLTAWNSRRKIWSAFWLLIFALLIADSLLGFINALPWGVWPEALYCLLFIYLYLHLRAAVTMKKSWI